MMAASRLPTPSTIFLPGRTLDLHRGSARTMARRASQRVCLSPSGRTTTGGGTEGATAAGLGAGALGPAGAGTGAGASSFAWARAAAGLAAADLRSASMAPSETETRATPPAFRRRSLSAIAFRARLMVRGSFLPRPYQLFHVLAQHVEFQVDGRARAPARQVGRLHRVRDDPHRERVPLHL